MRFNVNRKPTTKHIPQHFMMLAKLFLGLILMEKVFSGVIFPPAHVKSVLSLRATAQKQKGRKTFSSHIFIIIKFLGALFAEIISPEKSSHSHTCMDTQKFN